MLMSGFSEVLSRYRARDPAPAMPFSVTLWPSAARWELQVQARIGNCVIDPTNPCTVMSLVGEQFRFEEKLEAEGVALGLLEELYHVHAPPLVGAAVGLEAHFERAKTFISIGGRRAHDANPVSHNLASQAVAQVLDLTMLRLFLEVRFEVQVGGATTLFLSREGVGGGTWSMPFPSYEAAYLHLCHAVRALVRRGFHALPGGGDEPGHRASASLVIHQVIARATGADARSPEVRRRVAEALAVADEALSANTRACVDRLILPADAQDGAGLADMVVGDD